MSARRFDFWGLFGTLGIWAVIGTLAGYLGGRHWIADLFANFRPCYVLFLAPLALAVALRGHRRLAALFAVAVALNAASMASTWWPRRPPAGGACTLLVLNVQDYNRRYDETRELIRRERPDLVLLMEVNAGWIRALADLTNDLPHTLIQSRNDNFGIALYSRYRFRRAEIRHPGEGWVPVLDALCDVGRRPLRLLGAHAFPPWGRQATLVRNQLLHDVGALVPEYDGPTLLAGDLNVTPWSRHFRALQLGTGLEDAARGRGWLAGWPARLPAPFRFRKAYALAGPGVAVKDVRLGPSVGSDHLPLLVTFDLDGS